MSSNRLAINIGLKDNTLEHVGIHGERENPLMPAPKPVSLMADLGDDPEQAILMQILAKMLKRHKFTGHTQKTEYMKHRPRQWETIEDKLKTLDFESEMPPGNHDKNFKKDYVKQIKAQIKEIITTGRVAKMSTSSAIKEMGSVHRGEKANVGIKLA